MASKSFGAGGAGEAAKRSKAPSSATTEKAAETVSAEQSMRMSVGPARGQVLKL